MLACGLLIVHILLLFRAVVTFGLNALSGRHRNNKGVWEGDWESTNAYDFIKYTISKGYQIDSWEFGMKQGRNSILFAFSLWFSFTSFMIMLL